MQNKLFYISFVLSVCILTALLYPIPTLSINAKDVLLSIALTKEIDIEFSFVHSSELTPWIEKWVVRADGIYLEEICFRGSGAGHPSSLSDFKSAKLVIRSSYICFTGIDRFLGRDVSVDTKHGINMKIGIEGLVLKKKTYVHIHVIRKPLIEILLWGLFSDSARD